MLLWKEKRSGKETLLIDGARRVGKSWFQNMPVRWQSRQFFIRPT